MRRLIQFEGRAPVVLATVSLTMLIPGPAWANDPDFQLLRYPFFLWPAGALLSLVLLALAFKAWRLRQPSRRLGWALTTVSTTVILAWPYVVYAMGLGFAPLYRYEDLIALMPPLLAALAGLVAGHRAKQVPNGKDRQGVKPLPPV